MNNNELKIDYASKNTRFYNFIIDKFFIWVFFIIHVLLFEEWIKIIVGEGSAIKNIIYFLFIYFLYYLIFESLFGRTPAKFLTGTKVIDENENRPNLKTILIRNLSRLIPFDSFSFLMSDTGWHDSISKTSVINI